MKKNITVSLLILGSSLSFGQKIVFDKTTQDYGIVKKNAVAKSVFVVENKGDKPLILTGVKASCGCTVPKWSSNPIMPGKSTTIEVGYDTSIVGSFKKLIEVFSNDPKEGRSILWVKGLVEETSKNKK